MRQAQTVHAEGEILRNIPAVIANLEIQMELIAFAHQFPGRSQGGALRVMHFDLEFAAISLGGRRKRAGAQNHEKSNES